MLMQTVGVPDIGCSISHIRRQKKGFFMMTGYVKISRKIMQWGWYKDGNTCRLFLHMILRANWKDGERNGVPIPRGAVAMSYPELAQETGLSVKNIRTALEHLKKTGEVAVSLHAKFLVFTVKNYSMYQTGGMQVAENRHADGIQPATIKESKNEKIKNIYTHACAREGSDITGKKKMQFHGTGFSNFPQHEYDFDVLEQQLLQSQ